MTPNVISFSSTISACEKLGQATKAGWLVGWLVGNLRGVDGPEKSETQDGPPQQNPK